jgi:hypothetical protein
MHNKYIYVSILNNEIITSTTTQMIFTTSIRVSGTPVHYFLIAWNSLEWVHTCNITAYRNTVSWRCGRDSWPRNVSKVSYAVTLRACSVWCRYLAVASKGWYGYGWSRCGRATSRCTSTSAPLTYWDRGFESHRGHGYLSVVSVMCCQVEVSATRWSLVQRSPTDCAASLCVF